MKQPKKLTRNQKRILSKAGLDWKEWMFAGSDNLFSFQIVHKKTGEIKIMEGDWS